MIAVCTLGCTRKKESLPSWPYLFDLEGDYSLYFNYEATAGDDYSSVASLVEQHNSAQEALHKASFDVWSWSTTYGAEWRRKPAFDQDQARLAGIVTARNMCIEYAMQTDASHLLFIDADIVPPVDIIPRLLEVNHDAVAGLVFGRGAHSGCPYIFGEKRRFEQNGYGLIEAEHANIGFTMISRRLFEAVRMRWGTSHYPDGRVCMTSDDPAFHLDSFLKFGQWMYIRPDVLGKHVGGLQAHEGAQF